MPLRLPCQYIGEHGNEAIKAKLRLNNIFLAFINQSLNKQLIKNCCSFAGSRRCYDIYNLSNIFLLCLDGAYRMNTSPMHVEF